METKLNYENRTEKTPADAPLICCSVRENISSMDLENKRNSLDNPKLYFHVGSGYNSEQSEASMSGQRIFVLSMSGKPLTPCKPQKARKLLIGGVAKVVWNKFGEFGIQMLIPTREHTPKVVLGIDTGTKFEGLSLIVGKENQLNVMWLLPDKKKLVRKLKERRILRRAKRQRNCRRRECRFNNRSKDGFIAPSQLQIVQSRLKCIQEIMKSYPINKVAIEDVKFNHRDNKWGKNFSTIEVGKNMIKAFIIGKVGRDNYITFSGLETQEARERLGLKKSQNKSLENFNSHCVDSFSIASELSNAKPNFNIKVVDDTYRPTRRRLHDTQPAKGGKRDRYSAGNFRGVRKGTICEFGQIVGGTKKTYFIRNSENKRIGRANIFWLSHHFKTKSEGISPPLNKLGGLRNVEIL